MIPIRRTPSVVTFYQTYFIFQNYSTTSRQITRSINKLMRNTKKKKIYQNNLLTDMPQILSSGPVKEIKNKNPRRETILNKLFMRNVTDLLATGQYSSEILGNGIQISQVKITSDYKFLKIFWFCNEQADDVLVEKLLNKNAGYLEHELSQLRLMGKVPTMQFVKDKLHTSVAQIDKRLAMADFGEDHVRQDLAIKFKTEFQILCPLDDNVKKQIEKVESENSEEQFEAPLPLMTQRIFGVDHSAILDRVKKSMKKSAAPHRDKNEDENLNTNWVQFKVTQPINENPVNLERNKSQSVAFKEFLKQHQLQKLKAQEEAFSSKLDFMQDEVKEFYHDDAYNEKQEDYIIEEEIDKENR